MRSERGKRRVDSQNFKIPIPSQELHTPVLVQEILEQLGCRPGRVYVDCTVGMGGHSEAILKATQPNGRLIGLDRDDAAIKVARERLQDFGSQFMIFHEDFRRLEVVLDHLGIDRVDGVLFDLGVSSLQLSDPERGFSFREVGPLDMRMDRRTERTAADYVNQAPEKELSDVLYQYGEERWSRRIARAIVAKRKTDPIRSTQQLSDLVIRSVPPFARSRRIHPATRTFQALRILVNSELEGLSDVIKTATTRIHIGGRVCVVAFHSLEDRIVKHVFREMGRESRVFRVVTKKPIRPGEAEVERNPRSRSARLRVVENLAA